MTVTYRWGKYYFTAKVTDKTSPGWGVVVDNKHLLLKGSKIRMGEDRMTWEVFKERMVKAEEQIGNMKSLQERFPQIAGNEWMRKPV